MKERRTSGELRKENEELRQKLSEAEETLRSITGGEVDALVVNTQLGEQVFTLQGADTIYRIAIENINEGAITLSTEGTILYSNHYFARMLEADLNKIIGASIFDFIDPKDHEILRSLLSQEKGRIEVTIHSANRTQVPAYFATKKLQLEDSTTICAAVTDLTELKKVQAELTQYHEHLEDLVKQRTADLEDANKELEAFGYSVSHDLRQPLRAMESFSGLLTEEYRDKLDEAGKDYLSRIVKASQYMSELVDDMLKLSRITRAEMFRDTVNISDVAKSIAEELKASKPERKAEIKIASDLVSSGDKPLLNVGLRNLLENAWKFTGKTPQAQIEMGAYNQDGERVYFIRDNGIGFDMRYKDKLFQPFQRLHSDKDYPGTGIGLAIVQRIIRRHGGRIWAEAEIGKGATFYFTLG